MPRAEWPLICDRSTLTSARPRARMPLLLPRNRLPRTVTLSTWTGVRLNADAEVSPEMSQ
jgi:hypothetical protein